MRANWPTVQEIADHPSVSALDASVLTVVYEAKLTPADAVRLNVNSYRPAAKGGILEFVRATDVRRWNSGTYLQKDGQWLGAFAHQDVGYVRVGLFPDRESATHAVNTARRELFTERARLINSAPYVERYLDEYGGAGDDPMWPRRRGVGRWSVRAARMVPYLVTKRLGIQPPICWRELIGGEPIETSG